MPACPEVVAALKAYKNGKDRYRLIFGLRGCEVPDHVWDTLTRRPDGRPIMIPTAVGDDVDARATANALCSNYGDSLAQMFVLDDELVLFLSCDTEEDAHPTLVLRQPREPVEELALEAEDQSKNHASEEGFFWQRVMHALPTCADSIGGGTGFHIERMAAYMSSFEPDEDGLWAGEQLVAASKILVLDDYNPMEEICLDPTGVTDMDCGEATLILQSDLDKRTPNDKGEKELNETEKAASQYYTELLLALYTSIDLEKLPPPGELGRRLVETRYGHCITRALVQRKKGALRVTRRLPKRLAWIFSECPAELFPLIVGSLKTGA